MSLQPNTKNGKVTEFPYQSPTTSAPTHQPTQTITSHPAPITTSNATAIHPSSLTDQIVTKLIKKQAIQNGIVVHPRQQAKTPQLSQLLPTKSLYVLG